jgi:ribosomal protein L37AE/L43A
MKPVTSLYRCKHCGKTIEREGTKQWRKSFCEKTGKNARIMLVKPCPTDSQAP